MRLENGSILYVDENDICKDRQMIILQRQIRLVDFKTKIYKQILTDDVVLFSDTRFPYCKYKIIRVKKEAQQNGTLPSINLV